MDIMSLLAFLLIGGIAGWLAGLILRGGGFGIVGNIVLGVIGAVLGGFVFSSLGFVATSFLGSLVSATLGAVLFLFVVRLIKRA
jgi:uncharacterized membrane protein YeaQ/YmgE (transglycosylase-associated protein family)